MYQKIKKTDDSMIDLFCWYSKYIVTHDKCTVDKFLE